MARAKCQCCKKQLDTKEAFKVVVNGKNKYWCNEDCYKITVVEKKEQDKIKQEYDDIFEITKEIFRYEFTGYSLLKREIVMWEKLSTRQKIFEFLKEKRVWLTGLMSKEFQSDFHRVRYYSAVVSSKLHDFKPQAEVVKKVEEVLKPSIAVDQTFEIYNGSMNTSNTRRSFDDME